jgi:adenylate cyclase class 2
VGESNRVTYKGPRRDGPTKTREEIELPLGEGAENFEQWRKLFENLGFRPVAVVRKVRRSFHLTVQGRPIEVALDEAEGIGAFAEVEAIARDDSDLPAAQAAVLELAQSLGLSEVEPRSYLRMALERSENRG